MNRWLAVLAGLALSTSVAWAATLPVDEHGNGNGGQPKGPPPGLADRDRDGLSDGLQAQFETLTPQTNVEVVVTFDGPGNGAAAQALVGAFQIHREWTIIDGLHATMTVGQARALARAQGIFRVEENFEVKAVNDYANLDFGSVDARADFGVDGTDVGICVLDTGLFAGHEQFNSAGKVAGFFDSINGQNTAYDDNGHGTHVAGTAAGDGDLGGPDSLDADTFKGVAHNATLYIAKVLSGAGSATEAQVIDGIEWCAAQPGVQILSMSLGSSTPSDGNDALAQAVNAAAEVDKLIPIIAGGNSGGAPSTIGTPGAAERSLTVGAGADWSAPLGLARQDFGVYLRAFSSRGPIVDGSGTKIRTKPDVVGAGSRITSSRSNQLDPNLAAACDTAEFSNYLTCSGTSMATPYISGVVALMIDANPNLAVDDGVLPVEKIRNIFDITSHDYGAEGKDDEWGAGMVDVYRAMDAAINGVAAVDPTPLPTRDHLDSQTVSGTETWSHTFDVTELDVPITVVVTMTEGTFVCDIFCQILGIGGFWDPDLDARLRHPDGTEIAVSLCPGGGGECGAAARQETMSYLPEVVADIGTYTVEVFPTAGVGGTFNVDFSHGPLSIDGGGDPNNTKPVAANDAATVIEGGVVTVLTNPPGETTVLANDTDADGDPLTAVLLGGPAHGALNLNPDGTFDYTHGGGEAAVDSFTYRANDGTTNSNIATVDITVTPVNDPPTTADNTVSTEANLAYAFAAADFNFSDVDPGDSLQAVRITTLPAVGSLELGGVPVVVDQDIAVAQIGTLTFAPALDEMGPAYASFQFLVSDGLVYSLVGATMTIDVTPPPPGSGFDDPVLVAVGTFSKPGAFAVDDLNNDSDLDLAVPDMNDAKTVILHGDGAGGFTVAEEKFFAQPATNSTLALATANINGDALRDFTVANMADNRVRVYRGSNGGFKVKTSWDLSNPQTVGVGQFNPLTDTFDDIVTFKSNGSQTGWQIRLGNGNGSFSDGQIGFIGSGAGDPHSVLVADFNNDGADDFAYVTIAFDELEIQINDGDGTFSTLQAPFDASGVPNSFGVWSLAAADFDLDLDLDLVMVNRFGNAVDLLTNDGAGMFTPQTPIAAIGDPRSIVTADLDDDGAPDFAISNGDGTIEIFLGLGDGSFEAPRSMVATGGVARAIRAGDFNNDGAPDLAVTAEAEDAVAILLNNGGFDGPLNAPPTALFSEVCTDLDCSFTDLSTDIDGTVIAWSWDFDDGSGGSTDQHPNHSYAGSGIYTVSLTVTDNDGDENTTAHDVTVGDVTPPDVTAPTDINTEATGPTTPVNLEEGGAATANDLVDGPLDPTPDNSGPFTVGIHIVTWSATDSAGNTGTATQSVTITDTTAPDVTAPPDVTVVATGETTPVDLEQHGPASASDLVDGVLVPVPDQPGPFPVGVHVVTWSATDNAGNTGMATQTVTIDEPPPNNPPVAVNDAATVAEGDTVTVLTTPPGAASVLTNDTDADGHSLSAVLVTGAANGNVNLNPDGTFSYTHDGSETTGDSFSYLANDGFDNGNTATVTITVTPINDPPTTANNTVTTDENVAYVFSSTDFSFADDDPGDSLQAIRITSLPANGALDAAGQPVAVNQEILAADIGTLTFTPGVDESGTAYASFQFKVGDGVLFSVAAATMTVDVTPVVVSPPAIDFDPPVLVGVGNVDKAGAFAVDDFNNDLALDLAVPDMIDSKTVIFHGDGTGGFTLAEEKFFGAPATNSTMSVASADFNGDAFRDFAAANMAGDRVRAYVGSPTGFTVQDSWSFRGPETVGIGQFNAATDDFDDIVTFESQRNRTRRHIRLGDGAGGFTNGQSDIIGGGSVDPHSVLVADFNDDGADDIAYVMFSVDELEIQINTGNGDFQSLQPPLDASGVSSSFGVWSLATADFDLDLDLDLVVVNSFGNAVDLLINDGAGLFTPQAPIAVVGDPRSIATADLNDDGAPDFAISNGDGTVEVFLGLGDGGFQAMSPIAVTGGVARAIQAGDFDDDGYPDLAVTAEAEDAVAILMNTGPAGAAATARSTAMAR